MPRRPGSLVRARCCVCGTVELATGAGNFSRCTACKAAGRCPPSYTRRESLGRDTAMALVAGAIRAGELPHPRGLKCADCAGPAIEYDHRDYGRPLDVAPVCRSCNLRRGPGKPIDGGLQRVVARGFAPYRLRSNAERVLVLIGADPAVFQGFPMHLEPEHWQQVIHLLPAVPAQPEAGGV